MQATLARKKGLPAGGPFLRWTTIRFTSRKAADAPDARLVQRLPAAGLPAAVRLTPLATRPEP